MDSFDIHVVLGTARYYDGYQYHFSVSHWILYFKFNLISYRIYGRSNHLHIQSKKSETPDQAFKNSSVKSRTLIWARCKKTLLISFEVPIGNYKKFLKLVVFSCIANSCMVSNLNLFSYLAWIVDITRLFQTSLFLQEQNSICTLSETYVRFFQKMRNF